MSIKIIGAGLAGATVAQQLAYRGLKVEVFDERNHLGGNVHTERDPSTGVMVHVYGPHIFHTDDTEVWNYVNRFAEFVPYIQRTKARSGGGVYSFPINLHTINQVFRKSFSPNEARSFIAERCNFYLACHNGAPGNFEERAISMVGHELYGMFLRDYTRKQWGRDPDSLPDSILKRLPMRWDYNDNAYDHRYQGIPFQGYTQMVGNMLDHPRIKVRLGTKITRRDFRYADTDTYIFNSGAIDEWFDYAHGPLSYRTLDFERIVDLSTTDYQGCSVINACDLSTPWTRSTEHRHFTPWETSHTGTVVTREFSRECDPEKGDIRYYPIRLAADYDRYLEYKQLEQRESGVDFIGRLGLYQYLDMDKTIAASLYRARRFLATRR